MILSLPINGGDRKAHKHKKLIRMEQRGEINSMTEAQHQANVIKWSQQPAIRSKWPELAMLYHIPNGGSRDVIEARHLKQQGVKAGTPDLHLPVARGKYHSLYIEMKSEKGKTTAYQDWWIDALNRAGNCARVCHGWEEAVNVLEWYMNGAKERGG